MAPAAAEMVAKDYQLLVQPKVEPWGQTVARLSSPEGILVGIVYTPRMHDTEWATNGPRITIRAAEMGFRRN